jgi:hypothetical protein
VARHGLYAVDAGAEIDAIQIELEDLLLRKIGVDHEREGGFADLPPVRFLVRQKERAGQLLRQCASALDGAG